MPGTYLEVMNLKKKIGKAFGTGIVRFLKQVGEESAVRGWRAYLVGGTVRDTILGLPAGDIDITVEGDAIKLGGIIAKRFLSGAGFSAHESFGTCKLKFNKIIKLDLAMTRKEIYKRPGAMPKVKPGSLEDDLKRRDFTINAMAASINGKNFGKLFDPFNGRRDLKDGIIRVMHDGSFIDDPTRILRAMRFASRFGFRIESRTRGLMKRALDTGALDTVSSGRIEKEIRIIRNDKK